MEELDKTIAQAIAKFLSSDYGRGFIAGMQTSLEILTKKIQDPSTETPEKNS